MKEELLHYIWKTKNFQLSELCTSQKKSLSIIDFGIHNHNAGPDFLNATIRIENITWKGHIEMHLKSSDWNVHNHHLDRAYENVILHVVMEYDLPIYRIDGSLIPCLCLSKRINTSLLKNYHLLKIRKNWIPCEEVLDSTLISDFKTQQFLDAILIERLEDKTNYLSNLLKRNHGDWNQSFFELLAKYFGNKVNNDHMECLANRVGYNLIQKNKGNRLDIEALLFGVAGMLNKDFKDEYPRKLKDRYYFLKEKYKIEEMQSSVWKFSRMRPSAFPSIKIAQLAGILFQTDQLFSKIRVLNKTIELYNMFRIPQSLYWDDHYTFDKKSSFRKKNIGEMAIESLIINAIVPALFLYGKEHLNDEMQQRALGFLSKTKAEHNKITRNFKKLGFKNHSAYDSQSLLQLKKHYCDKTKCLHCALGHSIMTQ